MNYIIYCADDCLYLMSNERGYTTIKQEAGIFKEEDAKIICTKLNSANFIRRAQSLDERHKIIPYI